MRPPFPVAELLSSYPTPSVSEGGGGQLSLTLSVELKHL